MKFTYITRYWPVVALAVIDTIFFTSTNPTRVSAVILIIALCLVTASLYVFLRSLVVLSGLMGLHLPGLRRFARYGTGVLGVIIALNSIGELTVRDVTILIPLALILYLYMAFVRTRPSPQ